jgi:hypothetical protein
MRDTVLDKKEDVKHIPTKSVSEKVVTKQPKKNHKFELV